MTYRSDINNSNISTNRLLNENDLTMKYNQYKRNLCLTKSDILDKNYLSTHMLSDILPDNDNNDKYNNLRKLYDERIKSLYNQIQIIAKNFENDEILTTMKQDSISTDFFHQRMKEIIDENLYREREDVIAHLSNEIAELRTRLNNSSQDVYMNKIKIINEENENKCKQYEILLDEAYHKNQLIQNEMNNLKNQIYGIQQNYELEKKKLSEEFILKINKQTNEMNRIKSDNLNLGDQLNLYDERLKEVSQEYEENKLEMERLQKVISVLEIDLNSLDTKMKEKQGKLDTVQQELTSLQTQYFDVSLKYKKFSEENKSLNSLIDHYEKERRDMLDKYNAFQDDLHKSQNEKIELHEKQTKEKYNILKKKVNELKDVISSLEEELKSEKNNSLNIKISYSKIITKMQEDMKLIKNEWEKKCKDESNEYERIISEIENKNLMELNDLKHNHQIEIENKLREIGKLKQSSDLLKNFEKEYIRIDKHEEIINQNINEMKKKFNHDILIKEEEMENELKKKLVKIDDDKKTEYEFLTENTRKSLKLSEKQNEELRNNILELQIEYNKEKNNNENMQNNISHLQKKIRSLEFEIDQRESFLKSLSEKNNNYEEDLKSFTQSNKNFQNNFENLKNKLDILQSEKDQLFNEMKHKEEYYRDEISKLEKNIQKIKEDENNKYDKEYTNHMQTRNKLEEYEGIIEQLQNDNNYLLSKNNDIQKSLMNLENIYEDTLSDLKRKEDIINEYENKYFELNKELKNRCFENKAARDSKDLIIKILKTKLNTIRSEINSIKSFYNNEYCLMKKEQAKLIENVFSKVKLFISNYDKDVEKGTKVAKDKLEKEYKIKNDELQSDMQNEINKVSQKFEKHLLEQFRISEKLEKENKNLIEQQQSNLLKCKEYAFKIQENEHEIKSLNNNISKVKKENESLNETIEKLRIDKINLNKIKFENQENDHYSKRETIKKLQNNLTSITLYLSRMKNKYQQEIMNLKSEIENIHLSYENELGSNIKNMKHNIESLELALYEEKMNNKKILLNIESKDAEFNIVQKDIDKLKDIYENKIKLLNSKISTDDDNITDFKNQIRNKTEQLNEINNTLNDNKSQIRSLKTQLDLKNDELSNLKKEYEKVISSKDKKIHDLQSIVNQSLYSYNSGVNNIKIANKLDDEVKVLMKRAKIDENELKK